MKHNPGFLELVNNLRREVEEVEATDLQELLQLDERALLIDVREESEWAAGHVAGAQHLGKGILERDIESLAADRKTPLYLYCGGGYRSVIAAASLRRMGYQSAISVDGGWGALQKLLPVETPEIEDD